MSGRSRPVGSLRRIGLAAALIGVGCAWPAIVAAQEQATVADRLPFRIEPNVSLTHSLRERSSDGLLELDGLRSITTVKPGVRITSRSGRVQGSVDYSLLGSIRSRRILDDVVFGVSHRLSAQVRAEAIPDYLDVNVSATIAGQPLSAFGPQFASDVLGDSDQETVRTFSISPVFRATVAGLVAVRASMTRADSSSSGRFGASGTSAGLSLSSVGQGLVGWGLDATRTGSEFDGGRDTTTDRVVASLVFRPDIDWTLTVRAGEESTDIASVERRRYPNRGVGVRWTPSARTLVSIDADKRAFGNSHSIILQQRWKRMVFRYTDAKGVNDGLNPTGGGSGIRAYDLFFALFATQQPDPILRDELVLSFLERAGISPDAIVGGGFLASASTLSRRQELSWTYQGPRTVYLVAAYSTRTERADTESAAIDDLSFGPISQRGLRATVSHQVTSVDSANLTSELRRTVRDTDGRYSTFQSVGLTWSRRLGDRTSAALTVRRSQLDDTRNPYVERAVTATLTHRF